MCSGCETGPMVFHPYPRRLESLTVCRSHYKGSRLSDSDSVQHQFSPNNISRSTRVKVMRITKIDDQRENTLILNNSLNYS